MEQIDDLVVKISYQIVLKGELLLIMKHYLTTRIKSTQIT